MRSTELRSEGGFNAPETSPPVMSAVTSAPSRAAIELTVGDTVVHSLHGTGRVVHDGEREYQGSQMRYLTVRYERDDLTVSFPSHNASELGLRRPMDRADVQALLDILTSPPSGTDSHFVARRRLNEEALRSGDPGRVAMTVRDLHAREMTGRRLPPSEVRLKREAVLALAGEIAAALETSEEDARAQITARLPTVVRRRRGRPRTRTAA